jgi:hypothetical protein
MIRPVPDDVSVFDRCTVLDPEEVLVILISRTVVGVGIQDQPGIRHVLNEAYRRVPSGLAAMPL